MSLGSDFSMERGSRCSYDELETSHECEKCAISRTQESFAIMSRQVSLKTITSVEAMNYTLFTASEALASIKQTSSELNGILCLPSATFTRLLLNHFHWDEDALKGESGVFSLATRHAMIHSFVFRTLLRESRDMV